jgi:flagellar protein FlaG
MTEEEISSTGQFNAIGSAEVASYQPSSAAAHPSVNPTPAASPTPAATAVQTAAATSPADSNKPTREPTSQEIAAAIATANANLAASNRELDFRVDAATGISIALIRNSQTGVVVQQIPGADIIALARMLADWAPGKHMMLDLIA